MIFGAIFLLAHLMYTQALYDTKQEFMDDLMSTYMMQDESSTISSVIDEEDDSYTPPELVSMSSSSNKIDFALVMQQVICPFNVTRQGTSISLSEKYYAVAAPAPGGSGAVCIYQRTDFSSSQYEWRLFQIITNKNGGEIFGSSVLLSKDGSTLLISEIANEGQKDNVYVYKYETNGKFKQFQKLTSPVTTEYFGHSLSMSGKSKRIVIGSIPYESGTGSVYVYKQADTNSNYILETTFRMNNVQTSSDSQGFDVKMSNRGTEIMFSDPWAFNGVGGIWNMALNGTQWIQVGDVLKSKFCSGRCLMGYSIDYDENTGVLLAGAPGHKYKTTNSTGNVFRFEKPRDVNYKVQRFEQFVESAPIFNDYKDEYGKMKNFGTSLIGTRDTAIVSGVTNMVNFPGPLVFEFFDNEWSLKSKSVDFLKPTINSGSLSRGNRMTSISLAMGCRGVMAMGYRGFNNGNGISWLVDDTLFQVNNEIATARPTKKPTTKIQTKKPTTKKSG